MVADNNRQFSMIFDPLACHVQQFLHYNIQLYLVTFDPVLSTYARIKNLETEKVKYSNITCIAELH
jgi:hypothetical protein